jgi:hypothetical protein
MGHCQFLIRDPTADQNLIWILLGCLYKTACIALGYGHNSSVLLVWEILYFQNVMCVGESFKVLKATQYYLDEGYNGETWNVLG